MAPGRGSQVAISPRDIIFRKLAMTKNPDRPGTHHGEDRQTGQGIAKQQTERTTLCVSPSDTQKQPGADGSTKSDELNMPGFQSICLGQYVLL